MREVDKNDDQLLPLLQKDVQLEILQFSFDNSRTHKQKKSKQILQEHIIFRCLSCCCESKYDVTIDEYNQYIALNKKCQEVFNEKLDQHQKVLNNLITKTESILNKKDVVRDLGFQSKNPSSDFRAGGYFSLCFMDYFIEYHNDEMKKILLINYFPFALICIRLSFLVRLFFYLSKENEIKLQLESNKIIPANREQVKKFAMIEGYKQENFYILLSDLLIYIKKVFIEKTEKNQSEPKNIMKIDKLILDSIVNINI